MTVQVLTGDCLEVLRGMPDESVHCCVTSPPYWGLRDYGVTGQIGLESTPDAFVAAMLTVFQEVRRVLRDDGTCWLNLGDSYASSPASGGIGQQDGGEHQRTPKRPYQRPEGLKPKDLCGIPWRVAFALQSDGWWLRSDIVWSKPNPMPESVTDRPTKAHEYIFLLTKSERYYYDAAAIAEPVTRGDAGSTFTSGKTAEHQLGRAQSEESRMSRSGNKERKFRGDHGGVEGSRSHQGFGVPWEGDTRNKRTVWTVTTKPYSGAHFATFPPDLIEPCILAGCPVGGTVLDPFGGAGTTGLVADRLQRNAILIELNPDYAQMARERIAGDSPLFAEVS